MRADDPGLAEFAQQLHNEIVYEGAAEGAESLLPEVLTRRMLETLVEIGEVENVADCYLKQRGIVASGDIYAITCGEPMGAPGGTNMLKIVRAS